MKTKSQKGLSLFHLSYPIFIELVLQMLVGNVDQIMISQYSQRSVAAIGNANQIINFLIIAFSVVSMATTILVSQYIGSNKKKEIEETYIAAIFANFIFGLLVSFLLIFFCEQIFHLINVPDELMDEAKRYIRIIGSCMAIQSLYLTFTAMLRSEAFMRDAMIISIIVNILNIIGNAVLIGGIGPIPSLGLSGVAIASDISKIIGLIIIVIVFLKRSMISFSFKSWKPFPTKQLKKILYIGIPSGGESVAYSLSQIYILKFVNSFGTFVIATRVYANMFAMLSYVYSSAIAQATQIMVGRFIGAKQLEDANKQVMRTLKYALSISLLISTLLYFLSDIIYGFMTTDIQVIQLAKKIMFIEIFLELGRAMNLVMVRSLQGAGDIRFPIVLSIIAEWSIAVGMSYIFGIVLGWGLVGVWIAMACDEIIRGIIVIIRWKTGAWKTKSLVN